jgi:hypothetical protein
MKSASNGIACTECRQHSRLLRIESEAAKQAQKYHERDEAIQKALLELRGEIISIGTNVTRLLADMAERVNVVARMVPKKAAGRLGGGNGRG